MRREGFLTVSAETLLTISVVLRAQTMEVFLYVSLNFFVYTKSFTSSDGKLLGQAWSNQREEELN